MKNIGDAVTAWKELPDDSRRRPITFAREGLRRLTGTVGSDDAGLKAYEAALDVLEAAAEAPSPEEVVDGLLADLNDRGGLGLDGVDEETRAGIRAAWVRIIGGETE